MKKAKATKAKAKKTKKAKAKKAVKKAVSSGSKGCCTITFDDRDDEQVPNVTRSECTTIGRARGGVGQWNPGSCA